jgi:hypothetical protein
VDKLRGFARLCQRPALLAGDERLGVEPQDVIPAEAEPADWRFSSDGAMGAMPVVAVQPEGQFGGALVGGVVSAGVGPFAQAGLDEALGFAIGSRRVGFDAQMLDSMPVQRLGVLEGPEADAIVRHDALDLDAEALKEGQGIEEKAQARRALLVGQDFRVGEARMVVDRQMHVFPAHPAGVALASPATADPVADPIEFA